MESITYQHNLAQKKPVTSPSRPPYTAHDVSPDYFLISSDRYMTGNDTQAGITKTPTPQHASQAFD
jgi:hypothetical protein